MHRAHSRVAAVLFVALVALHLDVWRPQREVLWFGWLPEELAWRVAWMLAAALFVAYFTLAVWTEEDESAEGAGRAEDGGADAEDER